MKITLLSDDRIRYEPTAGPLTIEAPAPETSYTPFHMLGSSLATCTFSVLAAWGERAKFGLDDLVIEVWWTFAEKPHRVDQLGLDIHWPSLPASRLEAAKRAAALCTVHQTLEHPPAMPVVVTTGATDATAHTGAIPAEPKPSDPGVAA